MPTDADIRRWHTRRRPEPFSAVLGEIVHEGAPLGKSRWLVRILAAWPEVVGPARAKDHQPERFFLKDGVLTVASRSAMHAADLQYYLEEIRRALNQRFGKTIVKEIRTRQSSGIGRGARSR
jgi:hypothetical protein